MHFDIHNSKRHRRVKNLKVFDPFFYVYFSKFACRSENFDYSFNRESINLGDTRKVLH